MFLSSVGSIALVIAAQVGVGVFPDAVVQSDDATVVDTSDERATTEPKEAVDTTKKPTDLPPDDALKQDTETRRDVVEAKPFAPPLQAPEHPSLIDVEAFANALLRSPQNARRLARTGARTAENPDVRIRAVAFLVEAAPTAATGRICARLLRVDINARVRRKAAECLGRLPERFAAPHTSALGNALSDDDIDVSVMAAWALSSVGEPEAFGQLAAIADHKDPRVRKLALEYLDQFRKRHGLAYGKADVDVDKGITLVPMAARLSPETRGLQMVSSAALLGLYGGSLGWLHGGLFTAAYSGDSTGGLVGIAAMGGLLTGVVAGAGYGLFGLPELSNAQLLVQTGAMTTAVGYGVGSLLGSGYEIGLHRASMGLAGSVIGSGLGLALAHTGGATVGAQGVGLVSAGVVGLATSSMALGLGFRLGAGAGLGMVSGGTVGVLSTLVTRQRRIGLFPLVGAGTTALLCGALSGFVASAVEVQTLPNAAPGELVRGEGAGFAAAGGILVGSALGAVGGAMLPASWDPFVRFDWDAMPTPAVSFIPPAARGANEPVPVLALGMPL